MSLSVCKLSTGEMLVGEIVDEDEEYVSFIFPFSVQQHPSVTEGGFKEVIIMLPYMYKFSDSSGVVSLCKKHIITLPEEANETYTKLYKIYFIKQTLTDLRQEEAIAQMYDEVSVKLNDTTAESTYVSEERGMIH